MLEKLKKELRALLAKIKEYKELGTEERTAERRDAHKTDMVRIKEIEQDIKDLEEIEATESRFNDGDDDPHVRDPQDGKIEVEDQPIYRSMFPLGEQMRDIRLASTPSAGYDVRKSAESRLQQVEKRAVERFGIDNVEDRAAGDGMNEGAGGDGGFLLQGESAQELFTKGFNNNAVLSRTSNRTMSSSFLDIYGIKEDSRADGSRGGGVRVYTKAELEQMDASKTTFEKIRIEPTKLTGLYYASDEILDDVPALQGEMDDLFREDFAFKGQQLVLEGSGAGEPLGVKNSSALVSVAKETGQAAATIVAGNISKMAARVWARSLGNLVWLVNQDTGPSLDSLAYTTAKTNVAIYKPEVSADIGSIGMLRGMPVIPVEQCETVGTSGDILLVDLSQYITANRGGINSAISIHLKFDYNQTAFRFTYRFDGQPKWKSALTPYKGSNTVSPFVSVAVRA